MRFMVIVKADKASEAGVLPNEKMLSEMMEYNEELAKAGVLLAADGLHPTSRGARVRFSGSKRTVIDGPFTESKEVIAGFSIIQVRSKAEAIEWASRAPFPAGTQLEIRQLFEDDDFAASDPTGELRAQDEERRQRYARQTHRKSSGART
jgi:hypothetical protein